MGSIGLNGEHCIRSAYVNIYVRSTSRAGLMQNDMDTLLMCQENATFYQSFLLTRFVEILITTGTCFVFDNMLYIHSSIYMQTM